MIGKWNAALDLWSNQIEMADYVRVMISIAAQWRVLRAIGPAALPLAGVPVTGPASPTQPRRPQQRALGPLTLGAERLPVLPIAPPAQPFAPPNTREQLTGGPGTVQPQNGPKALK